MRAADERVDCVLTRQSLGAGFIAEQSGAASDAFDTALGQLRDKYAAKAQEEAEKAKQAQLQAEIERVQAEEQTARAESAKKKADAEVAAANQPAEAPASEVRTESMEDG